MFVMACGTPVYLILPTKKKKKRKKKKRMKRVRRLSCICEIFLLSLCHGTEI